MLQFGLAPTYVLDEIETYEILALMKYSHYRSKENWEQARLISFLIAQTHSSKKLKVEEIIKFPWEQEENKPIVNEQITQDDIEFLEKQAEEFKKYLD